jgi:3-deoxy-D-manno-octulosonic-acid transferase
MIKELKARFPGCTLVVSTITNSGYLMAKERIQGVEAVIFVPWDLPGATRRAVRAIEPDLLVLEYTEIWPNLLGGENTGQKSHLLMEDSLLLIAFI